MAAAGSRIGKTVLHIDPRDFYGGTWASFNLENIQQFVDNENGVSSKSSIEASENKSGVVTLNGSDKSGIEHLEYEWFAENEPELSSEESDLALQVTMPLEETVGADEGYEEKAADEHNDPKDATTDAGETVQSDDNKEPEPPKKEDLPWTRQRILKESRKFNIDLTPKVCIKFVKRKSCNVSFSFHSFSSSSHVAT